MTPIQEIWVFLQLGQSNGLGIGRYIDLTDPTLTGVQDDVLIYTGDYGTNVVPAETLVALQSGTGLGTVQPPFESGPVNRFGPELSFGRDLKPRVNTIRRLMAIIKHCESGTSLGVHWAAGGDETTTGDGATYAAAQGFITDGIAALQAAYPEALITVKGVIWTQGEADANITYSADYEANLTAFIDDIRQTYGADLPFVLGMLHPNYTGQYADEVRAAQAAVALAETAVTVVDTSAMTMFESGWDAGHYNSQGYVDLGSAYADAMAALL